MLISTYGVCPVRACGRTVPYSVEHELVERLPAAHVDALILHTLAGHSVVCAEKHREARG